MDNIRDRGNIKWTSMMLVEHKIMLRNLSTEQQDVEPPCLEDEMLEIITRHAMISFKLKKEITLTYWHNKRYFKIQGIVTGFDEVKKSIRVQSIGEIALIPYNLIFSSEVEEELL